MEDGKECGPSPGISCALVAEREDRGVYVAEFMRDPVARRRSENGGAAGDGGGGADGGCHGRGRGESRHGEPVRADPEGGIQEPRCRWRWR